MLSRAASSGSSREFVIMLDSRTVPSTAKQQQHQKTNIDSFTNTHRP